MKRKDLKIFTTISFFTALVVILAIPPFIYKKLIQDGDVGYILNLYLSVAILVSFFGIPISMVSMFCKENLVKRIFAIIINLIPCSLLIYAIAVESINEFLGTAP
ncbi:2-acyl-glycerophospho-ethanolamine acyltransferase [Ornithinibacillus gellani]|uniref:2-acyl-glycerophospho-ethanolamine acyltransferase n=1 Tax=Ornithinibacillus gellani TaxID=2293253 RepID=UPI000F486665|nr:2-acyl-glycerophospho-ethanolamine acyltransferase [Ornithinibacillus gellani]TQS75968.1 2-acyl-glycerophospho-ethanolamine acyltransferase [Ornithinibacillus gellani]